MTNILSFSWPTLQQWLFAVVILVTAWLVSAIVLLILRHFKALTSFTESTLDDEILQLLIRPIRLGFQFAGILIALKYLFPSVTYQGYGFETLVLITLIVWIAYTMIRLIKGVMNWYENVNSKGVAQGMKYGTFGFLNTIVSLMVWGLAFTFILNQLGVDVSALIAGLGIAGIAVALALQNTLSGLFSAVGIAIDRPIRQGDFIRLEDGTSGFVEDISMRSTRIRTFEQHLVIIPNSKLTEMIITNTYLPEQEAVFNVSVGIGYNDDLEKAERVALKVAEEILALHKTKGTQDPFVRFGAFGDSAIEMTIYVRVEAFLDQFIVRHEFIKALAKAFKEENITIPYPQRDIHLYQN
jgi:small-conductance mechanosensitive channel